MDNYKGPVGFQFNEDSILKNGIEKGLDYIEKHPMVFTSFAFTLLAFSALKMWIILR